MAANNFQTISDAIIVGNFYTKAVMLVLRHFGDINKYTNYA